ncbi:MAG TPA: MFS transporter [Pyrinomonadaceae bacterium]|nr:MFS transporter [Pyrinomonadaceae bacterium]
MLLHFMPAQNINLRILKILVHAGFFLSGIATVLIGQILPILAAKFSLNDEQIGNFFPAQFIGSLTGTILTNWFGKKDRFLLACLIGCFAMGAGVLMLNLNSIELCLLGFFINGIGIGLTLPSMNLLILELDPAGAVSRLSVLNFFWGFGAILSQPFVDYFSHGQNILVPTGVLSLSLLIVGGGLLLVPPNTGRRPPASDTPVDNTFVPIWKTPIAWTIAAFNFIHVGFESAMGGWLKTYTQRVDGGEAPSLFPPILLFFVFFVAGRGVAPVFFRFLSKNKMLFLSLLVVLSGMIVLLFARDVVTLGIGASIAGFGTSSVFPANLSRFTEFFGPAANRRATPFFILGTLGAALTNWFIGYISNYSSSLRNGMFLLLFSVVTLLVLQTVLGFQRPRETP